MSARRSYGDGGIYQRASDGRWVGSLRHVDPVTGIAKRTAVYGRSKKAVAAEVKKMTRRLDGGQPARDGKLTLDLFAAEWIGSTLEASPRKATTKALYAGITRRDYIGSQIGAMSLDRIKATSIERFLLDLRAAGKAESTVRQVYTVGRAIGDAAVRDGHLGVNPFTLVKRPALTPHEAEFLTPAQVSSLLAAAAGSRYLPLFELLVSTGLRRGEALALQWTDIDLTTGLLRVRGTLGRVGGELVVTDPKSARSRRTIPLSASTSAILRALRRRQAAEQLRAGNQWHSTGYVVTTELGEPCDPRNAFRALTVAAKAAGLGHVGLHTLRHSAASAMLVNGVPLTVVSQALGHSGIAITADTYGHVSPDVSRSAFEVLAQALAGAI
jgi:integrase